MHHDQLPACFYPFRLLVTENLLLTAIEVLPAVAICVKKLPLACSNLSTNATAMPNLRERITY